MKILSDFDGVLTDITEESARVLELFESVLYSEPKLRASASQLLLEAKAAMAAEPHRYGWKDNGRITAFCNEDHFVYANALAACLDDWAAAGHTLAADMLTLLHVKDFQNFRALGQRAFENTVAETSAGSHKPIDAQVLEVFEALLQEGVKIVVVSNSGTDRILQLLDRAGLAPVAHRDETKDHALRVRGGAQKFTLGEAGKRLSLGDFSVDLSRPKYEQILREERPDFVIGDVFSLDLALPYYLSTTEAAFSNLQILLRKRSYTPAWATDHLGKMMAKEKKHGVLNKLDELFGYT